MNFVKHTPWLVPLILVGMVGSVTLLREPAQMEVGANREDTRANDKRCIAVPDCRQDKYWNRDNRRHKPQPMAKTIRSFLRSGGESWGCRVGLDHCGPLYTHSRSGSSESYFRRELVASQF